MRFRSASLVSCRMLALSGCLVLVAAGGCVPSHDSEVVVYSALDREFSQPILEDFESQTGVRVLPKFDVESTKTVGLVTAIMQERNRPRCDVFWNNEILHTLRLQRRGLLEAFAVGSADQFPTNYRGDQGQWYGFAARARILLVNTELCSSENSPRSIKDLGDARWRDRCALAKPLFGTTATHAAVLFSTWGPDESRRFFASVKQNAHVLSGNKQVALAVAAGEFAFGLTDTDDAIIEIEKGHPVRIIYPDQDPGATGTLLIPNTLCILRDSPNPANARRLVEYLLRAEIEQRLAQGASAQFPLHAAATEQPRVAEAGVRWMDVDFEAAAASWDEAATYLRDLFATAD